MAKKNQLDDLFYYASRFVIVFPIIVIILAIVFNSNKENSLNLKSLKNTPTDFNIQPTYMVTQEAKIDLKGPYICHFTTRQLSSIAYIKDKKISLTIKELTKISNFILIDDCFYSWSDKNFSGDKVCGLAPYLKIAEGFNIYNLLNNQFLVNSIPGSKDLLIPKEINIKDFLNSCKKEVINDENVFNLPKNILFKNLQRK